MPIGIFRPGGREESIRRKSDNNEVVILLSMSSESYFWRTVAQNITVETKLPILEASFQGNLIFEGILGYGKIVVLSPIFVLR